MLLLMRWIWQQPGWPEFSWNQERLAPLEARFLHESGRTIGAWRHLAERDRTDLRIEWLIDEAIDTSAIEREILNRASVQSSIRRHFCGGGTGRLRRVRRTTTRVPLANLLPPNTATHGSTLKQGGSGTHVFDPHAAAAARWFLRGGATARPEATNAVIPVAPASVTVPRDLHADGRIGPPSRLSRSMRSPWGLGGAWPPAQHSVAWSEPSYAAHCTSRLSVHGRPAGSSRTPSARRGSAATRRPIIDHAGVAPIGLARRLRYLLGIEPASR